MKYFAEFNKTSSLLVLAGEGKAELIAQIWPCFATNLLKSNFPLDLPCIRKWHLSPMWCPSFIFKHLPSLQAATHCCRMPRYLAMPAITSLQSWQKHWRKPNHTNKHSSCYESNGCRKEHVMGRLKSICIILSSMKVLRYSAEKTLLTLCSCTAGIAGSSKKQREKLSPMDTDDQH